MDGSSKTKVLLLDDERFLLDMYRIVFERGGCEVTTFNSTDDALIALRAGYEVAQLASIDEATKFPANYHWPSDTPENLDWGTMQRAFAVTERFVRAAAG